MVRKSGGYLQKLGAEKGKKIGLVSGRRLGGSGTTP